MIVMRMSSCPLSPVPPPSPHLPSLPDSCMIHGAALLGTIPLCYRPVASSDGARS